MDLTETIAPKSDQINADDLMTGPRTFTIDKVAAGSPEQPVDVHLVELPGRPYRPSKSMRRVMVAAWGKEASTYAGHRLTLFRDPTVTFGRDAVGGIKISHLSDITAKLTIALTVTKGRRANFTVEPLPTQPTQPTLEQVEASTDQAQLRAWWAISSPERQAQIRARAEALTKPAPADGDRADEAAQLFADQP